MKSHQDKLDAAGMSSSQTTLPISFDRFVESVIDQLVGTTNQPMREDILASVLEAMQVAYVTCARRSEAPFALPITKLNAAEVVARGWIAVTPAELNSAVAAGHYYQIPSRVDPMEEIFPTWQFVGAAPRLIGKILPYLAGRPPQEIHAFWVCAFDELNELTPSEVLAGIPYETRGAVEDCQRRYMMLAAEERVQRVVELAKRYAISE